jgi:PKD domain-containing protein
VITHPEIRGDTVSKHAPINLATITRKLALRLSIAALLGTAVIAGGGVGAITAAAALANDDLANATVIDPTTLPFNDSVTIDTATLESAEPAGCYQVGKSIWYRITPTANTVLRADISSSSFFDRVVYVYQQTGSGFGGLSTVACASPYYNGQSSATFTVAAGKTYYLQAGGFFSYSTGTLSLSVQAIPPPPNDNFASATPVTSLPFSDNIDTTAATAEPGEPFPCGSTGGTAWYSYTPSQTGSVTATAPAPFSVQLAAYTGGSLGSLTSVGCRYGNLTIHVDSGMTYHFQVGAIVSGGGPIQFQLVQTPPPVANMAFYPGDPSIFDTVQFYDQSYDPGNVGFSTESWNFGDGITATGCCPTHRYAADADYTVKLAVTTTDGRTASISQVVHVRTHDVAITKLTVPQAASAGQTRQITVGVTDNRNPETVQVQLFKSNTSGGFDLVGTLTQSITPRGSNRTTTFSFSYTFTSADAQVGKVTFKVNAAIIGARDALPADNEAIALRTTVK